MFVETNGFYKLFCVSRPVISFQAMHGYLFHKLSSAFESLCNIESRLFAEFIYFSIFFPLGQKDTRPVHTSAVGQGWVVPSAGSLEIHPGAEPLHCFHGCRTEHILSQVLPVDSSTEPLDRLSAGSLVVDCNTDHPRVQYLLARQVYSWNQLIQILQSYSAVISNSVCNCDGLFHRNTAAVQIAGILDAQSSECCLWTHCRAHMLDLTVGMCLYVGV